MASQHPSSVCLGHRGEWRARRVAKDLRTASRVEIPPDGCGQHVWEPDLLGAVGKLEWLRCLLGFRPTSPGLGGWVEAVPPTATDIQPCSWHYSLLVFPHPGAPSLQGASPSTGKGNCCDRVLCVPSRWRWNFASLPKAWSSPGARGLQDPSQAGEKRLRKTLSP